MVGINQVRTWISQLTDTAVPHTAVFFGGTAGIGKATLESLVRLKYPVRVYVVGRKSTESAMRPFLENLHVYNPKADLIWLEAEASLLSEVVRLCEKIKSSEKKIDLLFMSAGYAPFGGRLDTTEGIDVTHALGYYSRMLFLQRLLPLLRSSSDPCVISVLAGTVLSRSFKVDDLHLEKSGAWSGLGSQLQMGTMNTLALETYASKDENSHITFIHGFPGYVNTGNSQRFKLSSPWARKPLNILTAPLFWATGLSISQSGERHLYMATGGSFGGTGKNTRGSSKKGLFLLNENCDAVFDATVLEELRGNAQGVVWDKTKEVLNPYM